MKFLKTYIDELDSIFGGGLIRGAVLSIIYDTYSFGWIIGFRILKNFIEKHGCVGVIHNYLLPVTKIVSRAYFADSKMDKSWIVIDIFGSKFGVQSNLPYVYVISNPTPETLNPKIEKIYKEIIIPKAQNGRILKLIYTVEGMVTLFGADVTIKILNSELALFARKYSNDLNIITIFLLNRDAVPKHLTAWLSSISDNLIVFKSNINEEEIKETMLVLKSPSPDFEPVSYEYKVKINEIDVHKPKIEIGTTKSEQSSQQARQP
ncbi:hypothetical protein [Thermococcus barophilus]|uniref:KaiC-like domain-containing protein n=1 Tax=Thermococcus barophilus TaxID=55802 RepID=A0A0S1XA65_THEBA|nr:hypothetical protein [Thermococcus barophilus]ALM74624.1 hypothetical protein TBCH5v1_0666 [Thermococcus barophilus]